MQTMTDKERNIAIQIDCISCGETKTLYVNNEDWEEFHNSNQRRYIQDIFLYLTPAERELLISGMCAECWEDLFGNFDED